MFLCFYNFSSQVNNEIAFAVFIYGLEKYGYLTFPSLVFICIFYISTIHIRVHLNVIYPYIALKLRKIKFILRIFKVKGRNYRRSMNKYSAYAHDQTEELVLF